MFPAHTSPEQRNGGIYLRNHFITRRKKFHPPPPHKKERYYEL